MQTRFSEFLALREGNLLLEHTLIHVVLYLASNHRIIEWPGLKGTCMGTVESWPEALIDHLRQVLSQLQGHR